MESILTSIKKLIGPSAEDTHFDPDIIIHINSVLADLTELGVGPAEGFMIEDDSAFWTDFIDEGSLARLNNVKTYIYLRVKLLFDPPANSAVIESMNKQIDKLEWRLNVAAESIESEE